MKQYKYLSQYIVKLLLILAIFRYNVQGTITNYIIPCNSNAASLGEQTIIELLGVADNTEYDLVNDRINLAISGNENDPVQTNTLNFYFILDQTNLEFLCEVQSILLENQKLNKFINFYARQEGQGNQNVKVVLNQLNIFNFQGSQTQVVEINQISLLDSIQGIKLQNSETINLNDINISSSQNDSTPLPEFRYSQLQILDTLNVNIDNLNMSNIGGGADKDEYENVLINNCDNVNLINSSFSGNKGKTRQGSSLNIKDSRVVNISDTYFGYNSNDVACGGLYIQSSSDVILDNVQFISNYSNKAGLFATNIQNLEINNSLFSENLGSYGAAGNLVDVTGLKIHKSTIQDTIGFWEPGGLVVENCDGMIVTESVFQRNRVDGWYGGTFYITGSDNIQVIDTEFYDNFTGFQGGSFQLFQSSGEMIRVHFENNRSPFKGNVMFLEEVSNLIIRDSTFIHQTSSPNDDRISDIASGFGGINIFASQKIEIYDSLFDDNIAAQGGDINTLDLVEIIVKGCTFTNSQAVSSYGGSIYIMNSDIVTIEDCTFTGTKGFNGASLGFQVVEQLTIKNCDFTNGTAQEQGGAFWFRQITDTNIENVNITGFVSQVGAGMYLEQCTTTLMNKINIIDNTAITFGGGIYIKSQESFTIQNSSINENLGYSGSGIYSEQSQSINVQVCNINQNIAENQGGGIYFNSNVDLTISDSFIKENEAISGGGMFLMLNTGNISFSNTEISQNNAQVSGGGLFIENDKSAITLNDVQILQNNAMNMNGGGIYISQSSKINLITLDILQNNCGQYGGAIYISRQKENVILQNVNINENKSVKNGAGIAIVDSENLSLLSSEIQSNISQENGSALYSSYTNYLNLNLITIQNHGQYISDGEYKNVLQGGSIYVNNAIQVEMNSIDISKSISNNEGGAVYMDSIETVIIQKSEFYQNNSGKYGGSLYIISVINLLISEQSKVYESELSESFLKASGGGIYIQDCQNLVIDQFNCSENLGMQYGGCLYLQDAQNTEIKNSIFEANKLGYNDDLSQYDKNQNYFISYGGAVYYETTYYEKNQFKIEQTQFIKNQASSGGSVYIIQGYENKIDLKFGDDIIFENNLSDVGPGIRYIGDQYNQNNISQMEKLLNENHKDNIGKIQKEKSQAVIIGYYFNERRLNDLTYQFDLCPLGTYLNQNENVSICKKCIEGAECSGGYIPLVPQEEYWRTSTDSDQIVHCYNKPSACRGNDTCVEGHIGVLCEECDIEKGFTKTRGGDCVQCSSNFVVAMGMLLTGFAYIVVQYMSVTSVLKRVNQSVIKKAMIKLWNYYVTFENRSSGIYKILIFHFQILYLIVNFDYEIIGFVNGIGNVLTDPGTSLTLDFDCFEKKEGYNSEDTRLQKTYHTFYGYGLTLGLLMMIYVAFLIKYLMKTISKKAFKGGLVLSMISLFITVQPGFISNSLQSIECRDIAEISVTLSNSQIQCDEEFYSNIILPINISILVFTGAIIPLILLSILMKISKKDAFNQLHNRRSFGFFYLEFKKETYYWDFILMAQKILIAFVTTFYMDQKVIQSAIVIIIIFIFMNITSRMNPYTSKHMTNLLLMSGQVQILTLAFILCIERSESVNLEYFSILGNICILTINGIFLLSSIKILVPYIFQNAYGFIYSYAFIAPYMNKLFQKKFDRERKTKQHWRKLRNFVKIFNIKKRRQENQNMNPMIVYDNIINDIQNNKKYNLELTQRSNILKSSIDPENFQSNNNINSNGNLFVKNDSTLNKVKDQNEENSKQKKQNRISGNNNVLGNSGQTQLPKSIYSQDNIQSQFNQNKQKATYDSVQINQFHNNNNMDDSKNKQEQINSQNVQVSVASKQTPPQELSPYRDYAESRDELNIKQNQSNLSQLQLNQQQLQNQSNTIVKSYLEGYNMGDEIHDIQFTFPEDEKN